MKPEKHAEVLIHRFLNGEASQDEETRLEEWRAEADKNEAYFREISATWDKFSDLEKDTHPFRVEAGWQKLLTELETTDQKPYSVGAEDSSPVLKKRGPVFWVPAIAALIAIAFFIFIFQKDTMETHRTAGGERLKITLPDRSLVWLNAGSQISYRKNMVGRERAVFLSGQAYFEVVPGERPFTVITEVAEIGVLGTKFDVWQTADKTRVVVKEGKVAFRSSLGKQEVVLTRGLSATCLVGQPPSQPSSIDPDGELRWMEGHLLFHRKPLGDVIVDLERHFSVTIELRESSLSSNTLTALYEEENLSTILSEICLTLNLRYELSEGVYYLFP